MAGIFPSRPRPGPPHPPSCPAGAEGARRICISAGQKAEDTRAPGRGRTDTGDPFRGPASSFGLRGLGNDTSAEPDYSRPAYGVEKDSPEVHIFNSSIIDGYGELLFYPVLPESCTESSRPLDWPCRWDVRPGQPPPPPAGRRHRAWPVSPGP